MEINQRNIHLISYMYSLLLGIHGYRYLSYIQLNLLNFIYFIMLMYQNQETENPFPQTFQQDLSAFVRYEKKITEDYKSRQQKNRERYEKMTSYLKEEQLKKQKRKQRKDAEKKKLHDVIDKMTQAQARAYLDNIKTQKKLKKQKIKSAMATGQMIILDLVYQGKMNNKENKSLGIQIQLIMKAIRHVEYPPSIHLCNFQGGIKTLLQKMRYQHWALTPHQQDLSIYSKELNKRLIYLSPDAPEPLQAVEENDVFILGGLIDRTILKNASLMRAISLGIDARRLPINEYMRGRSCLNLDHVVSMICKFKETGDWKTAFEFAAPKRWKKEDYQKEEAQKQEDKSDEQQGTSEQKLNQQTSNQSNIQKHQNNQQITD